MRVFKRYSFIFPPPSHFAVRSQLSLVPWPAVQRVGQGARTATVRTTHRIANCAAVVRPSFLSFTRTPPDGVVRYGAFTVHFASCLFPIRSGNGDGQQK